MPRLRALSFGVAAILAGCSPGGGAATAPSMTSSAPATSTPTQSAVQTVVPTLLPTAPPGLTGRLVFARFTEATHTFTGMFVTAADGSGEVAVPMPWTEGGGRWSASGKVIAVPTQLADGRVGTAIIDDKGAVLRVLAIAEKGLNLPCTTWSPDDARLACEGWDESNAARTGMYTVRSSDGGDIRRLTTPPAGMTDNGGDWSPDGKIVFKRLPGEEAPGALFLIDAAGGDPSPLTSGGQEDPGRFSPDGKLVATSSAGAIQVFDRSGTEVSSITQAGDFLFGPAWSPDGAWLVFSIAPGGQYFSDLFIARLNGADLYQVTRTSDNEIVVDWGADPP